MPGRARVQAHEREDQQIQQAAIELDQRPRGRVRPAGRCKRPDAEQGQHAGGEGERCAPAREGTLGEREPRDEQQAQQPCGQPDRRRKEPAGQESERESEGRRQGELPARGLLDEYTSQPLTHFVVTYLKPSPCTTGLSGRLLPWMGNGHAWASNEIGSRWMRADEAEEQGCHGANRKRRESD